MQATFFWAAAGVALVTFFVHTFIGGARVARPVIGAVLPLERLAVGHEVLETASRRGLRGKVAIDVSGEAETTVPPLAAAA